MTKEEAHLSVMGAISMALKSSTLQQGFEIICKNLSELEKENTELKEQNIKDCENFNKTMKEIKEQWNKEHYQLTKAKELLRKFLVQRVSKKLLLLKAKPRNS